MVARLQRQRVPAHRATDGVRARLHEGNEAVRAPPNAETVVLSVETNESSTGGAVIHGTSGEKLVTSTRTLPGAI